jgi:hypothetical protein
MYELHQIPEELYNLINTKGIDTILDEDLDAKGFCNDGQLCEHPGFENFFERLWVWYKIDEESHKIYTLVTQDAGNTHNYLTYHDMYVPDIIERINKELN